MGTRYFYIYIFTTQFCISKLVPLILSTVEYEEHQSTLPTEAQQHWMWCAHLICLCLNMFELRFVNQHCHRMRHSNRRWPDLCVRTACSCSRSIMISFASLSRYAMIFTLPAMSMEVENESLQYDRFLSFRVIFHWKPWLWEKGYLHMLHIFILDTKHKTICPWRPATSILVISEIFFCPPGTRTVYVETADHQRGHLAATVLHVDATGGRSLRVYLLMPLLRLHLKTWSVCLHFVAVRDFGVVTNGNHEGFHSIEETNIYSRNCTKLICSWVKLIKCRKKFSTPKYLGSNYTMNVPPWNGGKANNWTFEPLTHLRWQEWSFFLRGLEAILGECFFPWVTCGENGGPTKPSVGFLPLKSKKTYV